MTVTDKLTEVYNEIDSRGINLKDYGIHDDEDLILKALNSFLSNLDTEFDPDVLDMQAWNPDEDEELVFDDIDEVEFWNIVGVRE